MESTLTDRLLALDRRGLQAATQHPWLRQIGQGRLSPEAQLTWLKQDRLYAISYVSFIGSLLAKISIPTAADRISTLEWQMTEVLIDALVNIKRELAMFEIILRDSFGWGKNADEDTEADAATRTYQHLFAGAASPSSSILVGMTALWATEKCYFESWKYAKQQQLTNSTDNPVEDVVRHTLIPNWTNKEFESFVDTLGDLTNKLASRSLGTERESRACGAIWRQVLFCEANFWPDVEDEA